MPAAVFESETGYILKNSVFEIAIDKNGVLERWGIENLSNNILGESSLEVSINCEIEEPYITAQSVSVRVEYSTCFGELKRIFTVREKAFTVDELILAKIDTELNYSLKLKFKRVFDYFMLSKDRFDIEEKVERETRDFLLVNKKRDIYLGAIFKQTMLLSSEPLKNCILFNISHTTQIRSMELLLFSYTFSLV